MFSRDPKFTSQFTRPTDMWDEIFRDTNAVKMSS